MKGRVPTLPKPERSARRPDRKPPQFKGPGPKVHKPKGKANWRRRILVTVILLFVLLIVWAVASYLALRSGAKEANERRERVEERGARRDPIGERGGAAHIDRLNRRPETGFDAPAHMLHV